MKMLKAKDIMSTRVLSVQEDWTVDRLADFFIKKKISGASVVSNDGQLIGVVSLTDIARIQARKSEKKSDKDQVDGFQKSMNAFWDVGLVGLHKGTGLQKRVWDIMSSAIIDIQEETPVPEIAKAMMKEKVHRIFVTRNKKLVGIITTMDLLKIISEM
jgi:predicted transcriptional regulator